MPYTIVEKNLTRLQKSPYSNQEGSLIIIIVFYLPSDFKAALTANVFEHFNNTTAQWAKTRPQHRELPSLLFAMSVWVL